MTQRLDASQIEAAAGLLRDGALVAFGTETVYGLGADATNGLAVAAIYQAKGRPSFNPLICHYSSAKEAFAHTMPSALARQLAAHFWPGPLTLVLPRRADCPVSDLVSAGLATLAVRVPGNETARALIAAVGRPLAAPSANPSGRISPSTADHVLEGLSGRIAAVLDTGPCAVGLESTVVDLSSPRPSLLREGGTPRAAIEALIGPLDDHQQPDAPKSPGQLLAHYAPRLPLRLEARQMAADEALLAFGEPLPGAALCYNLSPGRNLREAASRLFAGLHWLDAEARARGLRGIAAMTVPAEDLGAAINDRLARAAHGSRRQGEPGED